MAFSWEESLPWESARVRREKFETREICMLALSRFKKSSVTRGRRFSGRGTVDAEGGEVPERMFIS